MKSVPNLLFFKPMKEEPPEHHWSSLPSYKLHLKIMQTSKGPYLRVSHTIKENPMEDGPQWIRLPYRPGEKCYVREAWCPYDCGNDWVEVCYRTLYNPNIEGSAADQGAVRRFPADEKTIELFRRDIEKQEAFGEKWRSPVTMPQWAARRFVTIVSCEPIRVEDVTREDCARLDREHLIDTSLAYNEYPLNYQQTAFRDQWRKRHPGKEWAWRVESEETEWR